MIKTRLTNICEGLRAGFTAGLKLTQEAYDKFTTSHQKMSSFQEEQPMIKTPTDKFPDPLPDYLGWQITTKERLDISAVKQPPQFESGGRYLPYVPTMQKDSRYLYAYLSIPRCP